MVRRQLSPPLRAKFDSVDVVQSVWADVLDGFRRAGWRFTDVAHLRAFLVKATRNRFIDRFRQHQRALEHEEPLPPAPPSFQGGTALAGRWGTCLVGGAGLGPYRRWGNSMPQSGQKGTRWQPAGRKSGLPCRVQPVSARTGP